MRFARGQGATEYLVLLAVVLIISLVSIALLGFFPGMAGDAKVTQNQMFWKSMSPIAILDGTGSENQVVMTLQNIGGYPLELIAVTTNAADANQAVDSSAEYGSYFSDSSPYRFFSPGVLVGGAYSDIIYPPRGTSQSMGSYTQKNMLSPGESITIGFTYKYSPGAYDSNGAKLCFDGNNPSKQMEYNEFVIYYAVTVDGKKLVKTERGKLTLPCS